MLLFGPKYPKILARAERTRYFPYANTVERTNARARVRARARARLRIEVA